MSTNSVSEPIEYRRGSGYTSSASYDRTYDSHIHPKEGSHIESSYHTIADPVHRTEAIESQNSIVTQLIKSSSIYTEAYEVLSSDKQYGTSYLSMLEMIPYHHDVRDGNFWDDVSEIFGATSGYDKAVNDAFNTAMDEIRTLMQDYYSFLSKLPSEQVEQLRDAGINASVTGEGVSPSSMTSPDPSGMVTSNPSLSEYNNTSLSEGISSFVEFIGAMTSLATGSVSSANLLGLLDIAERDSLNKQETHDLLMANLGVTSDSPNRVLTPKNTPAISLLSNTALSQQRVASAEAAASAEALDSDISVNVGDDPDNVGDYEIKSGKDWLSEISRFQIANRFGNVMIQNLRTQEQQRYAGVLSRLEGEYNIANFSAQSAQAQFNTDFFTSRDGSLEGSSQSSLSSSLSDIKKAELGILSVESWLSNYRGSIIEKWGQELQNRPSLAPYFYKAMFDFGMEDTFYHSNSALQGLKYGMESLNSIGSFLSNLTGFKVPKFGKAASSLKPDVKAVPKVSKSSK